MREGFPGRVGVQQGRLSARGERLQAFPHQTWRAEFESAKAVGFDGIEWLYEARDAEQNPIASVEGRRAIAEIVRATGVGVMSICASYFMVNKLAGEPEERRRENAARLEQVLGWAHELSAARVLVPLLETSAVDTPELEDEIVESVARVLPVAERYGVVLGLEMEIEGPRYAALLARIAHPLVGAYYDAGNSTAQGFVIASDVVPLLPKLSAVHIKDRLVHGGTQPIGRGDTDFVGLFKVLARARYASDFVFEHFFSSDPPGEAKAGLAHIERCMTRAAREAA